MIRTPLKSYRGLDPDVKSCTLAKEMPLDQFVRAVTRSVVTGAAYDQAMKIYCERYFEAAEIRDHVFIHKIQSALRGPVACGVLWALFLDSDDFRGAYEQQTGRKAPLLRERHIEASPTFFAEVVRDLKTATQQEEQRDTFGALQQQTRKVMHAAKEVDLINYICMSSIKYLAHAKPPLFQFFTQDMSFQMDKQ